MNRSKKDTRNMPDLNVRAAIVPSTFSEETRTVEVTFGTETPYLRESWWDGKYNEVLSFDPSHVRMDRLNSGAAPLLDNHDRYSGAKGVLGVVEKAWIENGEGRALVRFSEREEVNGILLDVKTGILKGISVGYRVYEYTEDSAEKKPAPAGMNSSKADETPTYTATDWEPMEISIAPVPADFKSFVRSDNPASEHEVKIIRKNSNTEIMKREQIIAMLTKRGITVDANASDEDLLATLERAMTAATPPPAPAHQPENSDVAVAADRKRSAEIRTLCRQAGVDEATTEAYINDNTTVDAVRAAVLEKFIAADPNKGRGVSAQVTADETDKLRERHIDAIVLRSGQVSEEKIGADRVNGAREFRSMTLLDLAKDCLTRAGIDFRGMDKQQIVGRAITSSSSDFPILLEGTNRRILLAAYQLTADTWRRFCSTGSVSDFREFKRLRLGSFGRLDKVAENAEYKTKKISDAEFEKVFAETYGNVINVSRKMIINDDLNGFARLAANLGRAAALSIETDVYALLAEGSGLGPVMQDGQRLFHSSHANIGTGAAISVASLDADRVLMASQKDPNGVEFLDIRPSKILVPISLGSTARVLNQAQYNPDETGKYAKPNVVAGLFSDVIDTPRITGTRRYLFADPNIEPVIEVSFLDGQQTPFMESKESFDVDGMQWKIRHDYGVGAVGWRGAVTNAGV